MADPQARLDQIENLTHQSRAHLRRLKKDVEALTARVDDVVRELESVSERLATNTKPQKTSKR